VNCARASECVTLEIWLQLENAINNVVDNITLADLVKRHNEKTYLYLRNSDHILSGKKKT